MMDLLTLGTDIFAIIVAPAAASFGLLMGDRWRSDLTTAAYLRSSFEPCRCDACGGLIGWLHRAPILGFFVARGRCASCGEPIPLYLPAGEIAALAFVVLLALTRDDAVSFLPAIAGAASAARSDWRIREVHPSASAAIALSAVLIALRAPDAWLAALMSAGALAIAFALVNGYATWRGVLPVFPGGDLILIAALGATLTPRQLPGFPVGLIVAAVVAAALLRRRNAQTCAPGDAPDDDAPSLQRGFWPLAPLLVAAAATAQLLPP